MARIASATAVSSLVIVGASSSISLLMRTPSSTDRSYSKASCGVRFIRSSRPRRDWSTPWAAASPSSVAARFLSEPNTLTKTRAC